MKLVPKSTKNAMSIPEIKHAFDQLDRETHDILRSGSQHDDNIKKFQKMWKRIFHRPVSYKSSDEFLKARRSKPTRKFTRKMKGGAAAALSGAPVDQSTGPGVYVAPGSYPAYWSQGGPAYPAIGLTEGCGSVDISAKVPVSIGSNQAGGGGGPLGAFLQGHQLAPSPDPSSKALQQ